MSEPLTPRPYSDRELTLKAISLTFHRAMAAQEQLRALPTVETEPDDIDVDAVDAVGAAAGDGGGSREVTAEEILADSDHDTDPLPNPIVTDANLRHYLSLATSVQGDPHPGGIRGRLHQRRGAQLRFNNAIVHALHQLDHRTRLQRRTIATLEAELADARRALSALEAAAPAIGADRPHATTATATATDTDTDGDGSDR